MLCVCLVHREYKADISINTTSPVDGWVDRLSDGAVGKFRRDSSLSFQIVQKKKKIRNWRAQNYAKKSLSKPGTDHFNRLENSIPQSTKLG